MPIRCVQDFHAWQLARTFKLEVYRVVKASPDAMRDFTFRNQIFDAAASGQANIEEGFHRYRARQAMQFLSYAQASLNEAQGWLEDGVDRGHFRDAHIANALVLGARAAAAVSAWRRSLAPFADPHEGRGRTKAPGTGTKGRPRGRDSGGKPDV